MDIREALSHVQGSLGGYKLRCNSKMTIKDTEAFSVLWDAVTDLENADRYKWHDLRKNPEDLPKGYEDNEWFECVHENHINDPYYPTYQYNEEYGFGSWEDIFDPFSLGFVDSEFNALPDGYEKVIAWREIEPFEEEEE